MMARNLFNVFLIGMLGIPAFALAALGEPVGSIESDKTSIRAASGTIRTEARYSVHEVPSDSGIVVREYAANDGTVFAVTWRGPVLPDLKSLLGKYFGSYVAGLREQHGDHAHAYVNRSGLVVQSSGRLRAFSGHAYLPERLPAGVTPDELH